VINSPSGGYFGKIPNISRINSPWMKKKNMYNRNSNRDMLTAAVTASLGAGVVTSFAVSQGQHPLIGLAITALAVVAALVLESVGK
jgi:hypothetical protein